MSSLVPFVNGLAVSPAAGPEVSPEPSVAEYVGTESKATLVALAKRYGLPTSGTKSEIVARLRAHAAEQLVDRSEGVDGVSAVAVGDDGVADGAELVDGEPAAAAGDDGLDDDPEFVGHED